MTNSKRFLFATAAACAISLAFSPVFAEQAKPLVLAQMMHGDKGMQGQPSQGTQGQGGQTMPGMSPTQSQPQTPGTQGQGGQSMPGMSPTQSQPQMPGMQGQGGQTMPRMQGMGEHGKSQTPSQPQMPGMQSSQPAAGGMQTPMAGGMMGCKDGCGGSGQASTSGMSGSMMGMQGGGMMPRRQGDIPSDRIEGRIAFLRAELKITPAQAAVWSEVEAALRANAKRMADAQPPSPPWPDMTPLEKADEQERLLAARLDSVRALKRPYAALYSSLDDTQKKTANELMAPYLGVM